MEEGRNEEREGRRDKGQRKRGVREEREIRREEGCEDGRRQEPRKGRTAGGGQKGNLYLEWFVYGFVTRSGDWFRHGARRHAR